jgi:AraC family transcriptional regulator, melibiose operon regulatory protein
MLVNQQNHLQGSHSYKLFAVTHQKGILHPFDFHTHFHYEIFIFHGGTCNYLVDNQIYELVSGDIIVMDGSKLHKPLVTGDPDLYDRSIVQFSHEWVKPLLQFLNSEYLLDSFQVHHHSIFRTSNENLDSLIMIVKDIEILLTMSKFQDVEKEMMTKLAGLLFAMYHLKSLQITETGKIIDEKTMYIQQVANYIQDHFHEKIFLDDIAAEVNLSKSYLVHIFKEQMGFTIMEYLMQYRLTQFLHLSRNFPDWTIKKLCTECGFESEAHFSRFFKSNLGLSPSVYRKTILKDLRVK